MWEQWRKMEFKVYLLLGFHLLAFIHNLDAFYMIYNKKAYKRGMKPP